MKNGPGIQQIRAKNYISLTLSTRTEQRIRIGFHLKFHFRYNLLTNAFPSVDVGSIDGIIRDACMLSIVWAENKFKHYFLFKKNHDDILYKLEHILWLITVRRAV